MVSQGIEGKGLDAEKQLEGNKGNLSATNSTDIANMKASYSGREASHPGKTVQDFAKQEAGKVGLSQDDIIAMATDNLGGKGLAAEKALEGNKDHLSADNQTDIANMQASYMGYILNHPGATVEDFAKQESKKVSLSTDDIEKMIKTSMEQQAAASPDAPVP